MSPPLAGQPQIFKPANRDDAKAPEAGACLPRSRFRSPAGIPTLALSRVERERFPPFRPGYRLPASWYCRLQGASQTYPTVRLAHAGCISSPFRVPQIRSIIIGPFRLYDHNLAARSPEIYPQVPMAVLARPKWAICCPLAAGMAQKHRHALGGANGDTARRRSKEYIDFSRQ